MLEIPKLAVYDETIINVKNHQIAAHTRVAGALEMHSFINFK